MYRKKVFILKENKCIVYHNKVSMIRIQQFKSVLMQCTNHWKFHPFIKKIMSKLVKVMVFLSPYVYIQIGQKNF